MTAHSDIPGPNDPGLTALVMLLRFHGVGADPAQIRHQCGTAAIGTADMIRCAREFGLKARELKTSWARLATTPLPAIAALKDGGFLLLGKVGDDKVVVQSTKTPRPELMTRDDLEAVWDGRIVLMTRRAGLMDLSRRFDITWFLGAIHKYRRQLAEVLVRFVLSAAVCARLAAVLSGGHRQGSGPSQHRHARRADDRATRDRAFETILGILRTYLFSHTTNRIDVELGARLFQHLLALPTAYFQARRVGNSVARVRELENIRTFLTSSALTLVIDLFFTFVFLGGHVSLFAAADRHRPCRIPVLHRDFRRGDAAVSPAARREVQARRGEPGLSGGKRHRGRDPQGDGGRAADAATLGRAARRLCGGELPGLAARQYCQQQRAIRQQGRDGRHSVFRSPAGHLRRPDRGRTGRIQHAGRTGEPAGAAAGPDLAGFSPGPALGGAARRHSQHAAGAQVQSGAQPHCRPFAATSRSTM